MHLLIGVMVAGIVLLALVALPILLLAGLLVLLLNVLLVPLKLLGWGLKLGAGLVGIVLKSVFLLLGAVLLVLFGLGMVPLIPVLLLGIGLYLVLRPSRTIPRQAA